ncbi:hypothetical protein EJB05_35963, partial [Eragrostis curvula]
GRVQEPRKKELDARINGEDQVPADGKPPYDTVTAGRKSSERRVTGRSHRMIREAAKLDEVEEKEKEESPYDTVTVSV